MNTTNPWKLSDGEAAALDAMRETGNIKLAARMRERAQNTIQAQIWRAMQKMQARNQITAILMWDRMRRSA